MQHKHLASGLRVVSPVVGLPILGAATLKAYEQAYLGSIEVAESTQGSCPLPAVKSLRKYLGIVRDFPARCQNSEFMHPGLNQAPLSKTLCSLPHAQKPELCPRRGLCVSHNKTASYQAGINVRYG